MEKPYFTYCLTFAFSGQNYYGWQRQPGHPNTIQQTMETVLRNLYHEPDIVLSGASRTDTGVHAIGMTASFRTTHHEPCEWLSGELSRRLPHDIVLLSARETDHSFNARSNAIGKSYIYVTHTGTHPLFLKELCRHWDFTPDYGEIGKILTLLQGTHDFYCLTGRHKFPNTIRTIYKTEMKSFGNIQCFYVSGNGFLYKMVRRIAGLLEEAGKGIIHAEDFQKALEEPGKYQLPDTVAPPYGLYLKKVFYSEQDKVDDTIELPPFF